MSNIPDLLRKKIVRELIRCKLLKETTFSLKDRRITFPDIDASNLLCEIACSGYRSYEGEVVTLMENYPWRIDAFIDGGANVGFYSVLGKVFFEKADIIAIEPFPENIEYINKLKTLNNLDFKLIDKALHSRSNERLTMYYPTAKTSSKLASSASSINSFKSSGGVYDNLPYKTFEVSTITLPEILDNRNENVLIKLDCEGNELNILKASSQILDRRSVDFIIELMINDKDKQDIFNLMKGFGYSAYLMTNSGFVKEDRPLTLPTPSRNDRTQWKNHFFTKRDEASIKEVSLKLYNYYI